LPRVRSVILNDRVLYRPLTGVGQYTAQLLAALRALDSGVVVRPFLGRYLAPPRQRAPVKPGLTPPAPNWRQRARESWTVRRVLQGAYQTAFRAGTWGATLYHEPNHIPLRARLPIVTTIHDLSGIAHPEWHPTDRVRWYEREFAAGVERTTRFIAASEFTRQDMVQRLGIPADRIDVTLQAPRPAFEGARRGDILPVLARFGLPREYLLFVGTLEPRKNVAGLLEAYAALPEELRRRVPLALVGAWGWKMEQLAELIAVHHIQSQVRLLGYVTDAELAALYTGCAALVWPTFYEGFGLPPLEAMSCGCPVIVSRVTSLPEVVGDGGVLLPPTDVPAWTEAMRRMVEDPAWANEWRTRGTAQAAKFSWRRCAEETLACYDRALAAGP
jgi:glycosyltransferase involved in cell wall biosynthesis